MEDKSRTAKMPGAMFVIGTVLLGAFVGILGVPRSSAAMVIPPGTIDPTTIPQWVNTLTGPPPVYVPTNIFDGQGNLIRHEYMVDMTEFSQQILPPPLPTTKVWGYGGDAKDALTGTPLGKISNSPAPSFEATRGIPIQVTWQNKITSDHMFCVDPTLHWADPNGMGMPMMPYPACPPGFADAQRNVPLIPHLHGGEVQSTSDGHPEAWFTAAGDTGGAYNSLGTNPSEAVFYYPNAQPPATLWYHDHALGITRINVMSGLAGFYFLRDPADAAASVLPNGAYEMPLAIQDRTFNLDGTFWFPNAGINPMDHPYWMPEFFGNTIMVNGMVWPKMNVDQGWYRFRLLDGSNARFYTLTFKILSPLAVNPLTFYQIGAEGGYLRAAAPLTKLTIAPGERADILIDFSNLAPGTKVLLSNSGKTPFPNGAPPDPTTTGDIVLFVVTANAGFQKGVNLIASLPAPLNPTLGVGAFPTLAPSGITRTMTLWEVMGMLGPLEVLLNGQKWMAPVSEMPKAGTTEDWQIVDLTADTHPIHLHLVQFQVVSRQKIDAGKYSAAWLAATQAKCGLPATAVPPWPNTCVPATVPIAPYLKGKPAAPPSNEQGWKDTVQMNPGEVTIIRVRFAGLDGNPYPFDPTVGPGYVWHCHIIDHEDNEMMRPYEVRP